jgi:asparagine synthase (glutamine-hydrolysing)
MCGIFSLINYPNTSTTFDSGTGSLNNGLIKSEFQKGQARGPESSQLVFNDAQNYIQGFHRLAINGLNDESNQPLRINEKIGDESLRIQNVSLICNGEIYNYKELYQMMGTKGETDSDCEVIIHLYLKYGIDQTLRMLDGVFAFILYTSDVIYVARDPYGVRPLYYFHQKTIINNGSKTNLNGHCYNLNDQCCNVMGFASELKMLCNIGNMLESKVNQFPPGHLLQINNLKDFGNDFGNDFGIWSMTAPIPYHILSFSHNMVTELNVDKLMTQRYLEGIYNHLYSAVKKRYLTTERPIACLLSGGLDSSLIAAIVCDIHKTMDPQNASLKRIETYSIGLPDSEDIKYARLVADWIGSKHTEIIVTEEEMLAAIPEVIVAIESYDVTTVRASIGNYLLGKYIKSCSDAKVIFNGDGADELCGGYLYMNSCPDSIEYDKEIVRLLKDIHLFDVLRSDKSISSHGLEPRTPFLDKAFVNYYLAIPLHLRNHCINSQMEKYLVRLAFSETGLLPQRILWRKKEAFSDGVSNKGRSLYQIIQDYTATTHTDANLLLNKREIEKAFYKNIFDTAYPGQSHLVPYYWMPKYIKSDDPSARTLATY